MPRKITDEAVPDVEDLLGEDPRFAELMARVEKTSVGKSVSASEWQEIMTFIGENLITDDRIMKEYGSGLTTGRDDKKGQVVRWLEEKAAALFIQKKDEEARSLRKLAGEVP